MVWSTCRLTLDATTVSGNNGSTVGGISNGDRSVVTLQNGSTVSGNLPNNGVGTITGSGCAA